MRSTITWRRNGLVALVAGAMGFAAAPALAVDVYIEFGATNRVCLGDCSDARATPQVLLGGTSKQQNNNYCGLRPLPGTLINFIPTGGTIGFNTSQFLIGMINESGGTTCGRVDAPGQKITVELGADTKAAGFNRIYGATIPIIIRSGDLAMQIVLDAGTDSARTLFVKAGSHIGSAQHTSPLSMDGDTWVCVDSGDCIVEIGDTSWTTMTFSADDGITGAAGEWSLGAARLNLTQGDLACGETVEIDDGAVSLTRLPNMCGNAPSNVCPVKIPYAISFDGATLDFFADYSLLETCTTDEGQNVTEEPAFEWTIAWDAGAIPVEGGDFPNAASTNGTVSYTAQLAELANRVPLSEQRFLDTDPWYNVDTCIGELTPVENVIDDQGFPIDGLALTLFPDDENADEPYARYDMSSLKGIQYGCFLERTVEVVESESCTTGTGEEICVQKTERIYVRGDWRVSSRL
ncbi:MAG: hypothetical protein ACNA7W_16010 [Pseudomonadales bacterium]